MDSTQHQLWADRLWNAKARSTAIAPLTDEIPGLTLEDAYRISGINYLRRLKLPGVTSLGKKIGLTSLAVQKQLGVGEPDFGYLTTDMQVADGGTVKSGSLLNGRAEGEVAFVLKRDLKGPGVTPVQVVAATDYVIGCIEIIDSRIEDWKIKIQDTVADNASSAMLVLGKTKRKLDGPDAIDLRMAGMTLRRNGEIESTGVGAACLDSPLNAVAWLANRFGSLGESLRAGEVILSGAYGPVVPFEEGDRCEVEISGLGKITCSYGKN